MAVGLGGPVVVGGDFNLPGLSTSLPPGQLASSDGGVQFVVAAGLADPRDAQVLGMAGTTDHPALAVALRARPNVCSAQNRPVTRAAYPDDLARTWM